MTAFNPKTVAERLQELNPDLKVKVFKDHRHFHYGDGVGIEINSFFTSIMVKHNRLILPEGWYIKDLPRTKTYQILNSKDEVVFIRVMKFTK